MRPKAPGHLSRFTTARPRVATGRKETLHRVAQNGERGKTQQIRHPVLEIPDSLMPDIHAVQCTGYGCSGILGYVKEEYAPFTHHGRTALPFWSGRVGNSQLRQSFMHVAGHLDTNHGLQKRLHEKRFR